MRLTMCNSIPRQEIRSEEEDGCIIMYMYLVCVLRASWSYLFTIVIRVA